MIKNISSTSDYLKRQEDQEETEKNYSNQSKFNMMICSKNADFNLSFSSLECEKDYVNFEDLEDKEKETYSLNSSFKFSKNQNIRIKKSLFDKETTKQAQFLCVCFKELLNGQNIIELSCGHCVHYFCAVNQLRTNENDKEIYCSFCKKRRHFKSESKNSFETLELEKKNLRKKLKSQNSSREQDERTFNPFLINDFTIYSDPTNLKKQDHKDVYYSPETLARFRIPLSPIPITVIQKTNSELMIKNLADRETPTLINNENETVGDFPFEDSLNNLNTLANSTNHLNTVNAVYMNKSFQSPHTNNRYQGNNPIRVRLSFQSPSSIEGFLSSHDLISISNVTSLTYTSEDLSENIVSFFRVKKSFFSKFGFDAKNLSKMSKSLELPKYSKISFSFQNKSYTDIKSNFSSLNLSFYKICNMKPLCFIPQKNETMQISELESLNRLNYQFSEKENYCSLLTEPLISLINARSEYLQIQSEIGHPFSKMFGPLRTNQIPILITIEDVCKTNLPQTTDLCIILGPIHSHEDLSSKSALNEVFFEMTKNLNENDRLTVLSMDDEDFMVKMCRASDEVKELCKCMITVKNFATDGVYDIFSALRKLITVFGKRQYKSNFSSIFVITDTINKRKVSNLEGHIAIRELFKMLKTVGLLKDKTFSIYGLGLGNRDYSILSEICYLSKGEFFYAKNHSRLALCLELLQQRIFSQKYFEGQIVIENCSNFDFNLKSINHFMEEDQEKHKWRIPIPKLLNQEKKHFIICLEILEQSHDLKFIKPPHITVQYTSKKHGSIITMRHRKPDIIIASTPKLLIQNIFNTESLNMRMTYRVYLQYLRLLLVEIIECFTISYLGEKYDDLESIFEESKDFKKIYSFLQHKFQMLTKNQKMLFNFIQHIINTIIQINKKKYYSKIHANYLSIISHTLLHENPSPYSDLFQKK